jgi:hypothetical protein
MDCHEAREACYDECVQEEGLEGPRTGYCYDLCDDALELCCDTDNGWDEPYESDYEQASAWLASAGWGTDEDYGGD